MLPVFAIRDMIDVLIMHIHFLPDVLAVRQLSREIYSWCRAVPDRRHLTSLFPGFPGSLPDGGTSDGDHHYRKLRSEHVTGEFVPHENFFPMDVFLRKLAGYFTAERQMEAHSSVTVSVARFVRYRKRISPFL
jgi:hypothetical protein